jgi:hypothetical protein
MLSLGKLHRYVAKAETARYEETVVTVPYPIVVAELDRVPDPSVSYVRLEVDNVFEMVRFEPRKLFCPPVTFPIHVIGQNPAQRHDHARRR